ncbi:MAG: lamin tail domain-containing protein [Candidatus Paceibacterota bacterium]|jgi:hypothetical protein
MKKAVLLLIVVSFFSLFHIARAGVVINEVQLLPTEERFIELYNQDSIEVDLTDWYIQRKTSTGASFGSLVSKTNFLNKKINGNGYFVISRSTFNNSDIVLSSLTLTESNALQIKNSNGDVVDTLCWGVVNDCGANTIGNPGEGQSLSRGSGGAFSIGSRSPGTANQTTSTPTADNNSSATTEPTVSVADVGGGSSESSTVQSTSIKTKIKTKNVSFVDLPLTFEVKSYGTHGEELNYGKYFWNFGDGTTEERFNNLNFTHTYTYPGEYLVSVEYFSNSYSTSPDVLNKIKIKIVPIELSISRTGDEQDFFVEIYNSSSYDMDLSLWKILGLEKTFTFPKNTNILARNKMILSPAVTHFTILDKNNLKLSTPDGKIIFPKTISENQEGQSSLERTPARTVLSQEDTTEEISVSQADKEEIPTENLLASVAESGVVAEKTSNSLFYPIIFSIFVLGSGGVVYFLRRNNIFSQNIEEFEILDE